MRAQITASLLFLSACVATEVQQYNRNTFRISAYGAAIHSQADANERALVEAAEKTLMNGYNVFLITSEDKYTTQGSYTVPGKSTSYTTGDSNSFTTNTSYTPAKTYTFNKPNIDMIVQMFFLEDWPEDAPQNLFIATEILKYLGPKFNKDLDIIQIAAKEQDYFMGFTPEEQVEILQASTISDE